MKNLYNSQSSGNYYKSLQRLENSLRNGSFIKYSLQKKQLLWTRLQRYAKQAGICIKASVVAACVAAGVCFAGSASAQTFTQRTGAANPLNGFNVGQYATPVFVDIDGDGDMDAFAGSKGGGLHFYKNTGTTSAPVFAEQTGAANPLDGISESYASLAFVDIDGDGDMDLFIGYKGEYEGTDNVLYFENTGTASAPVFTQRTGSANPLGGKVSTYYTSPVFVDIDGDGDQDCFVAHAFSSSVSYYKNTGTGTAPVFSLQTGAANPLNGVGFDFIGRPAFVDIDNDGDFDCFIGDYGPNTPFYFKNTGTATSPVLTQQPDSLNPFATFFPITYSIAPTFADIDGDGDKDAFFGNLYGDFLYYENTPAVLPVTLLNFTADKKDNFNLLQWKTAAEYNTSRFEIEYSDDGLSFTKIATVAAKGSGANTYTVADKLHHNNTVFYRVKTIDIDNKYTYSKVISISGRGVWVTVYPNPSHDYITLNVGSSSLLQSVAGIYDINGHLLQSLVISSYQRKVYVGALPAGTYILKLKSGASASFVRQ